MPDAAVAELRHVGLAEDDGTGALQALDGYVVFVGDEINVRRRSRDCPDTFRADQVLDAHRDAGERTWILAGHDPGFNLMGRRPRQVGSRCAEGVEFGFELLHALEGGLGDFDR